MPKSSSMHAKLDWNFAQSFGTDGFCEDDVFAAVEFDPTGELIALGDMAGRVTIFRQAASTGEGGLIEYEFHAEFQSHEREFDRLHSVEIEESINCIRWLKGPAHGRFMLTANDQTMKLWKVSERPLRLTEEERAEEARATPGGGALRLPPRTRREDWVPQASCKREFKHANGNTHIETVSMCSDGETFLSADPLSVNLWHLERSDLAFNVIDIKPDDIETLTEVITCATYHPRKCGILAYGTSEGVVRMADLRDSALVTGYAKTFAPKKHNAEFSEITQSLSDVRFTPDGRFIVTRDYTTVKLWDVRSEKKPVVSLHVHQYLEPFLGALNTNACIFDKFDLAVSPDGAHVCTGSYDSNFTVSAVGAVEKGASVSASGKAALTETVHATSAPSRKKKSKTFSFSRTSKEKDRRALVSRMDFAKKALHTAWHPTTNAVAVASLNKVYIYQAVGGGH